jgi:hypothetical protein
VVQFGGKSTFFLVQKRQTQKSALLHPNPEVSLPPKKGQLLYLGTEIVSSLRPKAMHFT